ncbi:MAG: phosphopentomutase [Rhodospirillales bacterium]|jgi:phosphopentomutase
MARAFVLVMDSFGIGAAPDAARFGDVGADTWGHIRAAHKPHVPNLVRLGLDAAHATATGLRYDGPPPQAWHGAARERSFGKDTPSGHWEMAGVPVEFEWGYFPKTVPSFPAALISELVAKAKLPGVLGDCHASGTQIIDELGLEHIATGKPIVYTSADSVFQIAAHESHFGLARLLELCKIAFELVQPYKIARVIARPFVGDAPGRFKRTANRKDYAVRPPAPTLFDKLNDAGRKTIAIGKIGDIYAHQGTQEEIKADGNDDLMAKTLAAIASAPDGSFTMTNFVDFDTLFGHRRDAAGYAAALAAFDRHLPTVEAALRPGDIAVLTADHGCDPTWPGSDHTREHVPVLCFGPGLKGRDLGARDSFADIGQSLAAHLGIAPLGHGKSFI